jgi:hypothetical protein
MPIDVDFGLMMLEFLFELHVFPREADDAADGC